MKSKKLKRVIIVVFLLAMTAYSTDRIALFIWGKAVINYYQYLRSNVKAYPPKSPPSDPYSPCIIRYSELNEPKWPSDCYSLILAKTWVRPYGISTHPYGGISITFIPPIWAWSTRLFPHGLGEAPPFAYHSYSISITYDIEKQSPKILLWHGVPGCFSTSEPVDTEWPYFHWLPWNF
jgi:hypothetical protein